MRPRAVWLCVLLAAVAGSCSSSDPHDAASAAPISRDLWEAARDADLTAVERLIAACADPLVAYPHTDGRTFTAREVARARLDGLLGPEPGTQDTVALALAEDLLRQAEEAWAGRCSDRTSVA